MNTKFNFFLFDYLKKYYWINNKIMLYQYQYVLEYFSQTIFIALHNAFVKRQKNKKNISDQKKDQFFNLYFSFMDNPL